MRDTHGQRFLLGLTLLTGCASVAAPDDGVPEPEAPSSIVVDDTGFFVDRQIRWSATTIPTITGSITGPGTSITVRRGDAPIAEAVITDGRWTLPIPANTLGVQPAELTFVVRVDESDRASLTRAFAADITPPVMAVLPTSVANELDDIVSFGSDGTVVSHAHIDTSEVTLGGDGCPDVFKHAYLMEANDSNPIRWQFRATDDGVGIDPAATLVRIGTKDGEVFGPWRPVTGSGDRDQLDFEVDALRTIDPFLGEIEAAMVIQIATKDHLDREAVFERCWTHHPLAVPLFVKPAAQAAGHPLALPTNRLESGIVFHNHADLINPGSAGLSVLDYDVFNGTVESAEVTFKLGRPQLFTRRDYVRQSAVEKVRDLDIASRIRCNETDTDPRCETPSHPPKITSTGITVQESPQRYAVRVLKVNADGSLGDEVPCITCDANTGTWMFELGGKLAASEPGARYRVMTVLREVTNLFPSGASGDIDGGPFTETLLRTSQGDFGIVGKLIGNKYTACTKFVIVPVGNTGNTNTFCTQLTDFQHYRALTRIEMAFNQPLFNRPTAAVGPGTTSRATGMLVGARTLPAFSYDTFEALPAGF